ncbi:MAG: hypothetical protein QF724_06640 [Planctomycetota bacterium]|nr:hypothetical protein [Planctomycetota bacterium]MDP6838598.1 hypothetical protein [Planctomycetota bacterium]
MGSDSLLGWLCGDGDSAVEITWSEWEELDLLAPVAAAHGWRGPVARWLATLDELPAWAGEHLGPGARPGEVLAEELGLWLAGAEADSEQSSGQAAIPWTGKPLARGRRLADREEVARQVLGQLSGGERIVVHGFSQTLAATLTAAWKTGRETEVVLSESPANLGGRRMALGLVAAGLPVRLAWDLALFDELPAADWLWLGTEAIGAGAFLAPRGSRALLEAARRLGVATAVVTTTDKLMPGGELIRPAAGEESGLLWELPPEGVALDSCAWEAVPLDLPMTFITEQGAGQALDIFINTPSPSASPARTDTFDYDKILTR